MLRRSDTADFVSFVYGDCTADDDMGCAPPLEIQVWPACRRHLALYGSSPLGPTVERTTVRGVPAAVVDGGTRLELQTGRSTVWGSETELSSVAAVIVRTMPPGSLEQVVFRMNLLPRLEAAGVQVKRYAADGGGLHMGAGMVAEFAEEF